MTVGVVELQWQVGQETGDAVLEKMTLAFERMGDELGDFGKWIYPKLTPVFEAEAKGQFAVEGGGPSGPWAALSPAYARWKEQEYPGQDILRRTDKLFEALTDSTSAFALRETTSTEFNFGTAGVEYASFHQLGTDFLSPRPLFDFGSEFEDNLQRAAAEGAREAISASGIEEFAEVGQ